ncbi:MAG: hypothetical protein ACO1RT_10685 [Planctomycetaceae bacterium]
MQKFVLSLLVGLTCFYAAAVPMAGAREDFQSPALEFMSLPEGGAKSAGFSVSVSCEDLGLFGDIPVVIQVTADASAFTADRSISIRLTSQGGTFQPPGNQCDYELSLQLPEGLARVTRQFYLPKWSIGGEFELTVLEDRRPLEGYRARFRSAAMSAQQAQKYWWAGAGQRFGWITLDANDKPDARVFFTTMAPELLNVDDLWKSQPGFDLATSWRQFRAVPIDSLPQDWRGFDAVDVWVIEAPTLRKLVTPPAGSVSSGSVAALKNYIRCGGTLWVVGQDAAQTLPLLLDAAALKSTPAKTVIETAVTDASAPMDYASARATTYQTTGSARSYIREYAMNLAGRMPNITGQQIVNIEALFDSNLIWVQNRELDGQDTPPFASDFMVHNVALGRVIAYQSAEAVPGTPQQWRTLAALTASDASETLRRAVDPCFGDRRFWDWIIPDVAQPPVYTFIGLLLVFVIVVGPLAYRKFSRLGRAYLMMFVAPLLALFTTLTMFAYGLLADGLSTRERARVITWIGDMSGTAARYSRTTYFAGIRPTDGMRFPANASVVPYQLPSVANWHEASKYDAATIGTIRMDDGAIHLDSGFLPSRQQKQFVTYRPVDNVGTVRLDAAESSGPATLHSDLAFDVRQGVLCDATGNYFLFDQLPAGRSITPTAVSKRVAGETLSDLYAIQRPIAPAAVSSARRAGETTIDMVTMLAHSSQRRQSTTTRVANGESWIEDWLRTQTQIASELPPGMFIAVAEVPEDCVAVASAELVESVHYVIGVLP